jgi:hypothetical protein
MYVVVGWIEKRQRVSPIYVTLLQQRENQYTCNQTHTHEREKDNYVMDSTRYRLWPATEYACTHLRVGDRENRTLAFTAVRDSAQGAQKYGREIIVQREGEILVYIYYVIYAEFSCMVGRFLMYNIELQGSNVRAHNS